MRLIHTFICILFFQFSSAQISIVPMPVKMEMGKGSYRINQQTRIVLLGSGMEKSAMFLQNYLLRYYGLSIKIVQGDKVSSSSDIYLNYARWDHPIAGAYQLQVLPKSIFINGDNEQGIFYGVQTLLQLLPVNIERELTVPVLSIEDYPRFEYRGMHLDVSRHFFPVWYIKKYLDLLAYHKFNTFHWHLTDDQGWRIEIKKYPLLTQIGSIRAQTLIGRFGSDVYDGEQYGGYYTQRDIAEIIQYAADRYITVIPEIDIPGHSLAALASYPYLGCTKGPYKVRETWAVQPDVFCAGNDSTYKFIEDVMDEVMQLFPSQYIHIGGDECPKEKWKTCTVCQQKIKNLSLKNENELQSYFVHRVEKYLNSKGRKIIGWDEILEGGLAPNATVMSWRGTKGGIAAAKQSHDVIMTPEDPLYLNLSQSKSEDSLTQGGYNPLEKVYSFNPVPIELNANEAKFIKGLQGEVWTEYISNASKLEYMVFPRMSAIAETGWTSPEKKNWSLFESNLPALMKRYDFWKVNYSMAFFDLQASVVPSAYAITWKLETKRKGRIIYVKGAEQNVTYDYTSPIVINQSGEYGAAITDSNHIIISNWIWQKFSLNKASGKKITLTTMHNIKYAGQGGFSLIDGVQNTTGMLHSSQFLGFIGNDMEAIIDLGLKVMVDSLRLHCFEQKPSWIYRPSDVSFSHSLDGINFTPTPSSTISGIKNLLYVSPVGTQTRYIKVKAFNNGIIRAGLPGAGGKAWLFIDEIEVL